MSSSSTKKRGSGATVKACDSCRRRKRKCVWTVGAEGCAPCLQSKEACSTTHIRKPRAKSEKRNRVAEYEARIQRLESLLEEQSAAQPRVQQQPLQPADQSIPLSNWVTNLQDEVSSWPLEEGPHLGPEAIEAGFQGFFEEPELSLSTGGSLVETSPSSLHPPFNSAPFSETRNNLNLNQDHTLQGVQITHVQPPLVRAKCDGYMPHPELGTSLLSEFLVDFNTAVPLYRPYVVVEHLRRCYGGGSDGTTLAWCTTYVVFGIAHRLRAMSAAATPQDNDQADYFMHRLLQGVSSLLLDPPSLGLIQSLLGLAVLIQTSSHPTPHATFVSTALRMAQGLAYDDDRMQNEDPDQDIEQQRRVFWIALFQDTDESILSTAPVTHHREDIVAKRPEDDPEDAAGAVTAAEGGWRVNIFALRARLAILQAEAIEKVLSVKARNSSPEGTISAAYGALQELQSWRNHNLFRLSAEQLMQLLYRSDLIHVLSLEASYFATVFRLHASLLMGTSTRWNPFSSDVLARLTEQKEHPSYQDAKRLLSLLSVAPQGDIGVCWSIKLPVIAALCTVLSHAIHDPDATPSRAEMTEYSKMLHTLSILADKSQDVELQKARSLCMMLFSRVDTARRVMEMQGATIPEPRAFQTEEVIF